jgi:hypothetical protein
MGRTTHREAVRGAQFGSRPTAGGRYDYWVKTEAAGGRECGAELAPAASPTPQTMQTLTRDLLKQLVKIR